MYFVKCSGRCLLVASYVLLILQLTECKKQKDLDVVVQHKPEDCGELAEDGDEVSVHYTGFLDSGDVFDSSIQQKRDPLKFVLGQRKVIPGWEQGIKGMCVGEKRKLVIPPHLAYGKKGHPPVIPESATLTFETELMELKKPGIERIEQKVLQILQFLAFPILGVYIIYYLYDKYRQEATDVKSKDLKSKDVKRKKRK